MLLNAELYDVSVDYIVPIGDANKPHYCATAGTSRCHHQQQDIAKWRRHRAPIAGGGIVDLKCRRTLRWRCICWRSMSTYTNCCYRNDYRGSNICARLKIDMPICSDKPPLYMHGCGWERHATPGCTSIATHT